MSLRSKIIAILSVVVVLYAAFDNGLQRVFVGRSFDSWEREDAARRLSEAKWYLDDKIREVDLQGRLLAGLEPVRDFVTGRAGEPPEGIEAALGSEALDLLYLCDADGRVLWGRLLEPETRAALRLREFPEGGLSAQHPLFATARDGAPTAGLMLTERWPILVARHPVAGATGMASVVAGRFFAEGLRKSLKDRATLDIDLASLLGSTLDRELMDEVTTSRGPVSRVEEDRLRLYETYADLRHQPSILLQAGLDRSIAERGRKTSDYALLSTIATALLIMLALLRLLQRIVIRPLSTLTRCAVEIGQNDDTTMRVDMRREDEIGQLSNEFDRMLEKLAHSREQVVRTARLAGMSEIATGVLHNVGNVLNSVNVSTSLVAKRAGQLAVGDLERVLGVMNKHEHDLGDFVTNHPKGKALLPVLNEVSTELASQKAALLGELESLGQGIDHIADLVRSQQTYAGTKGVFELARLDRQVEAALKICGQAGTGIEGVEIVREYEELPPVHVDKHKLMEILVNLLQNARQALAEVDRPAKRVTIRIRRTGSRVRLEVADNGPGISADNLARVFHHGFTTKKDGHGFGLHVSANAATEMGASLRAESEGLGHGATFVLEIPMQEAVPEPALAA